MQPKTVEIPKEKASFWMDGHGRWHNQHGPFQHKKIIQFFNQSIKRDAKGYYVAQYRDGIYEKVYFRFADTALFVVDIIMDDEPLLLLNTSARIPMLVGKLFICNDQLYFDHKGERIKFCERALLKVADRIHFERGQYYYTNDNMRRLIPSDESNTGCQS